MAIIVPKNGDVIDAVTFGKPVADEVNRITPLANTIPRMGAARSGMQASLPGNTYTLLTWATTVQDTGGVIANTSTLVVPPGGDGLWVAQVAYESGQEFSAYMSINMGSWRFDTNATGNGRAIATNIIPMAAGESANFYVWVSGTTPITATKSGCWFYRIGV